eukprot:352149-Chlamydomonas_euryale.AAC.6
MNDRPGPPLVRPLPPSASGPHPRFKPDHSYNNPAIFSRNAGSVNVPNERLVCFMASEPRHATTGIGHTNYNKGIFDANYGRLARPPDDLGTYHEIVM